MNIFDGVKFNNSFAKLSKEFYTKQKWSSFEKAHLISFNKGLAKELGLNPELKPEELVKVFNGEIEHQNSEALAMVYAGHQFGNWVPQLGDGRGILFGQIETLKVYEIYISKGLAKLLIQDLLMAEPS